MSDRLDIVPGPTIYTFSIHSEYHLKFDDNMKSKNFIMRLN